MSMQNTFDLLWWIWWSNPQKGSHPTIHQLQPLAAEGHQALDYLQVFELRELLDLPDFPTEQGWNNVILKSVTLSNEAERRQHLIRLAALSLDTSIINLTAQDWKNTHQVEDANTARLLISEWNSIPTELKTWNEYLGFQISLLPPEEQNLNNRISIALSSWIRTHSLSIHKRWQLTQPQSLQSTLRSIAPPNTEQADILQQWCTEVLQTLSTAVIARLCPPSEDQIIDNDSQKDDELDGLLSRIRDLEGSRYA